MSIHQSELHRQQEAWKAARQRMTQPFRDKQAIAKMQELLDAAKAETERARRDVARLLMEIESFKRVVERKDRQIASFRSRRPRKPYKPRAPKALPNVEAVIEATLLGHHGVSWDDVWGKSRTPKVVAARHECVLAVRAAYPGLSYPDLGRIFNKHHTSILYIVQESQAAE